MLFVLGLIFLLYSYLLYPFLLKYLLQKKQAPNAYATSETRPTLSIVIAAHNEEKVLREKLDSILQSAYPQDLIEILIGITPQQHTIIRQFLFLGIIGKML